MPPIAGLTEDRVLGCLLGGALGDCLGSRMEGRGQGAVVDLRIGRVTDDTQLTMLTVQALLRGGPEPAVVAETFREAFERGELRGLGSSTAKAMNDLRAGAHWALAGHASEHAAGNGAAMRVAPLAFVLSPDEVDERRRLRDICRITHRNDEAWTGALAVVEAIRRPPVAPGPRWLASIAERLPDTNTRDRILELSRHTLELSVTEVGLEYGSTGYVVDSVPFALYAASKLPDDAEIRDLFVDILSAGGDTDTNASIFGQIAGATLGYERLPADLIEVLWVRDELVELGRGLFAWISSQAPRSPRRGAS